MKSLLSVLPAQGERSPISDDERCPRCQIHTHLGHQCCQCLDAGRVRLGIPMGQPGFGESVLCPACHGKQEYKPSLEEWRRRSRVPLRFENVTIYSWEPMKYSGTTQPRPKVAAWGAVWPPEKPVLLLFGNKGTGKTTLAWGALRNAFERYGIMGAGWNCTELMARYRGAMAEHATETEGQIDRELDASPLLLLDDYGAQQDTEWARSKLYGLINRRYEMGKPMVVTTNATLTSDRTVSRLVDVESTVAVQFDGKDVREG